MSEWIFNFCPCSKAIKNPKLSWTSCRLLALSFPFSHSRTFASHSGGLTSRRCCWNPCLNLKVVNQPDFLLSFPFEIQQKPASLVKCTESWQNYSCNTDSCQEWKWQSTAVCTRARLFYSCFFCLSSPKSPFSPFAVPLHLVSPACSLCLLNIFFLHPSILHLHLCHMLFLSSFSSSDLYFQCVSKGKTSIISCGYIFYSFFSIFPLASPNHTHSVVPPVLPLAVLNIPVHTHESESWPSVSTRNRNTRNALSPRAPWSSRTCNLATISVPTRGQDAVTSKGITLKFDSLWISFIRLFSMQTLKSACECLSQSWEILLWMIIHV